MRRRWTRGRRAAAGDAIERGKEREREREKAEEIGGTA